MNRKEGESAAVYYENTKNAGPRPLTVKAAGLVTQRPAYALDLGCGALRDTKFLLEKDFYTFAVDIKPEVIKYAKEINNPRFQFTNSPFQELPLVANSLDFVSAQHVLSYNPKGDVKDLIRRLNTALRPSGVFAGNLLGKDDAWNKPGNNDMSFYSKIEAEELFVNAGFGIILLEENWSNEPTDNGEQKYSSHFYEIIARK